jgi:RND family efflux transporter MFP subunit
VNDIDRTHLPLPAEPLASQSLQPAANESQVEHGSPGTPRVARRFVVAGAVACVALAAAVLVATRHHTAASTTAQPVPALTVTAATPHRVLWPRTLQASGAVAPWQEASIGTQIGGFQLIDVRVNVGDHVKKGQVLAEFDTALLRADEAQLQANYDQAEANRQRAEKLVASASISAQDLLQTQTLAKTAAAALASKQLQLRYAVVVAPDDGTISARSATLGAVVPASQELFRLIRQDRLEWRGELTATQLADIRAGQHVALTLPDGSSANAKIREVAPSLDAQSRLGIVYADVVPGSRARAGMYAKGQIELGETAALAVPADSIVIRDGRNYVATVSDGGATSKVQMRAVSVGRRQGSEVEIEQGLTDTDQVIAQGAGFLSDGDVVRLGSAASSGDSGH